MVLGLYVLPNSAYFVLLHPRDMAVDYLVAGSPYGARTGFYNLVEPQSFTAFCADYIYAILRLTVPVLFYPGPKEFAMLLFVGLAVASVFGRKSFHEGNRTDAVDLLASLVIGHMAVSMLFEPDLGSYIRHLSSVALSCAWRLNYLGPRRVGASRNVLTGRPRIDSGSRESINRRENIHPTKVQHL
ncbi:hypothetical protein ACFFYR_15610 [Paraburkholderia dipogonis]|uniref:hypothetical protein n=1 Tax=Paraburkholderia dipogonis TaxID=1211383 RepID=UPI0035E56C47